MKQNLPEKKRPLKCDLLQVRLAIAFRRRILLLPLPKNNFAHHELFDVISIAESSRLTEKYFARSIFALRKNHSKRSIDGHLRNMVVSRNLHNKCCAKDHIVPVFLNTREYDTHEMLFVILFIYFGFFSPEKSV